jgi:hypothetical protein
VIEVSTLREEYLLCPLSMLVIFGANFILARPSFFFPPSKFGIQ